jgi:hypothetical protein
VFNEVVSAALANDKTGQLSELINAVLGKIDADLCLFMFCTALLQDSWHAQQRPLKWLSRKHPDYFSGANELRQYFALILLSTFGRRCVINHSLYCCASQSRRCSLG